MKKHIKLILRTLISNNACVEAARTKEPKYTVISIIFVLFALFFAALPTCVTGFQQNGGNWLRGPVNYSFDTGIIDFYKNTEAKGVEFHIVEENNEHVLKTTNWSEMPDYKWKDITQLKFPCSISTHTDSEGEEHKVLEVFVCPDDYDFNLYVEEIAKNINPLKVHKETKDEDEKKEDAWLEGKDGENRKNRSTSFLVFGKRNVQGALYAPGVTTVASSGYGDYGNTPLTTGGLDLIHTLIKDPAKADDAVKAFQTFFDQAYVNTRFTNTWRSTGIILGVDAGIILLMGFMVWILTRGKNNPFRIYSFWDGQKIAYYACLTPGIISLFGFLMSNMAMMLFILGVGVRVMWLSMRTLRYQAPNKQ